MLLAVRSIGCPLLSDRGGEPDRWRLTSSGLVELLLRALGRTDMTTETFGSLTTALACQLGLASSDLRPEELRGDDIRYPIVVGSRVVKPQA